jgi:signal transduction histidine kinase
MRGLARAVRERASVGRRLFLLVGCQTAIAAILVLTALHTIFAVADDYRHMYDFQFKSIYVVRQAMEKAVGLQSGFQSPELDAFYQDYRINWQVASGNTPDAVRFRKGLSQAAESTLLAQESDLLADLERSIRNSNAQRVREDLAGLYDVNLKYVEFAHRSATNRIKNSLIWLLGFGAGGIGLTLFLGLHVRRAIAPRIQRLVGYVRRFQNRGVYEQITEKGNDDIAVLTNALNAGFSAIASRERDREQFLAVAAHELKTPVASIHGYASLLVTYPQQAPDIFRALEIIDRQSWRLSRLIETLFLAMRARSGDLSFKPKPLNMSVLLQRVLHEMEPFLSKRAFTAHINENISILGDEDLLEHALWSLFTCATALAARNAPVRIALFTADHSASLTVDVESDFPMPDVEGLFTPFRSVEYETGAGIRSAIGLYLCREIVRVHNGRLVVHEVTGEQPEFLMELPA